MKFRVWVKHVGDKDSQAWQETFVKNIQDPKKWARKMLKQFNATLAPQERHRKIVLVIVLNKDVVAPLKHRWKKTTDKKGTSYKCCRCGITGKLGDGGVERAYKFRGKQFEFCKEDV